MILLQNLVPLVAHPCPIMLLACPFALTRIQQELVLSKKKTQKKQKKNLEHLQITYRKASVMCLQRLHGLQRRLTANSKDTVGYYLRMV